MSKKTIIILHNEKESKIELNLEEITSYSILKKQILDFYKESDDNVIYHLMAINSSINKHTEIINNQNDKINSREELNKNLKKNLVKKYKWELR